MKPVLSIEEKEFAAIPEISQERKLVISVWSSVLIYYDLEYKNMGGLVSYSDIMSNVFYINALFKMVSCLSQYYEFSDRHFQLLQYALENVERLYPEACSKSEKVLEIRQAVISSLEKTVLIFQTVVDAMPSTAENNEFILKCKMDVQKWLGKLYLYSGEQQEESCIEAVQRLYQKYSQEPVIGEFLQRRVAEYQVKIALLKRASLPPSPPPTEVADDSSGWSFFSRGILSMFHRHVYHHAEEEVTAPSVSPSSH